jgi:hypothetical protein
MLERKVTLVFSAALFLLFISMMVSSVAAEYLVSPSSVQFPQKKQNEAPMAVNPLYPKNAITEDN